MNEYIPLLLIQWWAEGHRIEWTHSDKTLSGGDLCFYLSYGKIVTQATRKRYKHNLVIHESNLPAGRGWSPATWQILEKKKQITVTLFEAADSVDSGPIYLQENINLKGMELLPEWRLLQVKITEKLCQDFVGNYPEVVQSARLQEGEASFYPRRTPEDSRLDISCSLKEQFNLFRVVDNVHYPAFFALEGTEYILNIQKRLK
jgi:methionyl-tRNA formyltransferase